MLAYKDEQIIALSVLSRNPAPGGEQVVGHVRLVDQVGHHSVVHLGGDGLQGRGVGDETLPVLHGAHPLQHAGPPPAALLALAARLVPAALAGRRQLTLAPGGVVLRRKAFQTFVLSKELIRERR